MHVVTEVLAALALCVSLCHAQQSRTYCRITELPALNGRLGARGGMPVLAAESEGSVDYYSDCAWVIRPSVRTLGIKFELMETSRFHGQDILAVLIEQKGRRVQVASFDSSTPIPFRLTIEGNLMIMLVFSAESNASHFLLAYDLIFDGAAEGSSWFSPAGYAFLMAGMIVAGLLVPLLPLYIVVFLRAKRRQEQAIDRSEVVVRSSLGRHRNQAEATEAQERQVAASLEALPTERWSTSDSQPNEDVDALANECCLCMETYKEDEILRILPCKHFFHQACVDRWFASRRFLPRSCPLCKRNPVAADDTGESAAVDPDRAENGNDAAESSAGQGRGRHAETSIVGRPTEV
eukprot:TRINITY_DN39440_c0_g1_i1.p1 TRINITY_DN39440_c0_g1~~TRINITY_DN39440_c0_g1_i1.p1  ORF type:complete len:350 (+),score=53.07 TRINITY_DN39440_c0_g1_i1:81-1130(+)